jgi:hypothetical protein
MIVRHAEKPSADGQIVGVKISGAEDPQELTPLGWQRAGALVRFFAPVSGDPVNSSLAIPGSVFASGIGPHSKSMRPQHTVAGVAAQLGLKLNLSHLKGEESALAVDVVTMTSPVLVGWEHEAIPAIVNAIVGNDSTCPQTWPGTRFDLVWVLDQASSGGAWNFTQVPQMLLPGDSDTTVPLS